MFSTWVRRRARRQLLFVVVALVAIWGFGIGVYGQLLTDATFGTEELQGDAAAARLAEVGAEAYVDVEGDATLDTGLEWVSDDGKGNQTTEFQVAALAIGDRLLLVKVEQATDAVRFRGRTEPVDPALLARVTEGLDPADAARVLPVTVDATTDWRLIGTLWLVGMTVVSLGLIAYGVVNARRAADPTRAKDLRTLDDPAATLAEIDADLARPDALATKTGAVGQRFLATAAGRVVPTADVVWVYTKVTKQKLYGVVTVGSNSSTIIVPANGKELAVQVRKKDRFTPPEICSHIPWAIGGFSHQVQQAFAKPESRVHVVADVAARRDQMLAPAAQPQAAPDPSWGPPVAPPAPLVAPPTAPSAGWPPPAPDA